MTKSNAVPAVFGGTGKPVVGNSKRETVPAILRAPSGVTRPVQ